MATTETEVVRPNWYTESDDSAWSHIKEAFRRDWQQTEHDFGANASNLNQQIGDTLGQATGSKPIPPGNMPTPHAPKASSYHDEDEPNYRYGYAAYRHFVAESEAPDDAWENSEETIRNEWHNPSEWEQRRDAIRRGWDYGRLERQRITPK